MSFITDLKIAELPTWFVFVFNFSRYCIFIKMFLCVPWFLRQSLRYHYDVIVTREM